MLADVRCTSRMSVVFSKTTVDVSVVESIGSSILAGPHVADSVPRAIDAHHQRKVTYRT